MYICVFAVQIAYIPTPFLSSVRLAIKTREITNSIKIASINLSTYIKLFLLIWIEHPVCFCILNYLCKISETRFSHAQCGCVALFRRCLKFFEKMYVFCALEKIMCLKIKKKDRCGSGRTQKDSSLIFCFEKCTLMRC